MDHPFKVGDILWTYLPYERKIVKFKVVKSTKTRVTIEDENGNRRVRAPSLQNGKWYVFVDIEIGCVEKEDIK